MPGVGDWIFYYLLTALLASLRRGSSVYIKVQWQEMEILWDEVKILILLFLSVLLSITFRICSLLIWRVWPSLTLSLHLTLSTHKSKAEISMNFSRKRGWHSNLFQSGLKVIFIDNIQIGSWGHTLWKFGDSLHQRNHRSRCQYDPDT